MCLFFCSTAYCAASGRVCPSSLFCLSRCVCWVAVWQPLLYLDLSGLKQSVLPLDVSVLQQPVLTLDMPLLLQSSCTWGHLCLCLCLYCPRRWLSCSILCFTWTYLFNCSLCCARRWPTAACGAPGLSVYKSQCCTETCLPTGAFVCTWGVCRLHTVKPVLHLFVSVYKIFVLHLKVSVFKSLWCICAFLSTRALFCTCACLQSTRVLCCTWTCLPTWVQCMQYLEKQSLQNFFVCFGFFRNSFVCIGCFDTCSKHRNKPKISFFGFTKQTEKQPKQIVFRFFSVQTENIFCLFRGHPIF
jgi:hypothetical protein